MAYNGVEYGALGGTIEDHRGGGLLSNAGADHDDDFNATTQQNHNKRKNIFVATIWVHEFYQNGTDKDHDYVREARDHGAASEVLEG